DGGRRDRLTGVFVFFLAEDGIRDRTVTGVQTCALPIYLPETRAGTERPGPRLRPRRRGEVQNDARADRHPGPRGRRGAPRTDGRSEERRVGKECRAQVGQDSSRT